MKIILRSIILGKRLIERCKEWGGGYIYRINVCEFNTNEIEFYEHLGMKSVKRKMKMNIEIKQLSNS